MPQQGSRDKMGKLDYRSSLFFLLEFPYKGLSYILGRQKGEIPMKRLPIFCLTFLLCSCSSSITNPLDFTYTLQEGDSVLINWNSNLISAAVGDTLTVKENQVSLETPSQSETVVSYTPVLTNIGTNTYTSSTGQEYEYSCFYLKKETTVKTGRSKKTFTGKVSLAIEEKTSYVTSYTDINSKEWADDANYRIMQKEYGSEQSSQKYFYGTFMAVITQEEYERYIKAGGSISFTPLWSASWGDSSLTEEKEITTKSMNILISQGD